ncbi:MAG: hypothetical protein U1F35_06520 [Steroidobacteraceae bacterium]
MDTPKVTPAKGLLHLLAVIVVIGIFVALAMAVRLSEMWAGFLFLLYWSMAEGAKPQRILPSAIGAFVGMGTASMMVLLPPLVGRGPGIGLFAVTVLVLVYALIVGWASIAVNMATMLFLTVGTIPHLEANASYGQIFLGMGAGIIYFCGLALAATFFTRRKGASKTQT